MPAAGPNALAIAVYSDVAGDSFAARESGFEGVACVDDAARCFVLLSTLAAGTRNAELRRWAEGLLEFLIWMHAGEGQWVNFIYDWDGTKNLTGLTSKPGFNFWQARATHALATAALAFDHAESRRLLRGGLDAAAQSAAPANVRSIQAMAALVLLRAETDQWLRSQLARWCDELVACSIDGVLMNSTDERGKPHLWGHIQEAVLAEAARSLGRPELIATAKQSADAVFASAVDSGFDSDHVQPYEVESTIFVMDRLFAETSDPRFESAAARSREWFGGRNPARSPVYMRDRGRVGDGVDRGTVSRDSGAEANICGGLALMDDPFVQELAESWPKLELETAPEL